MTTKSLAFISFVEMVKSKGSISEAIAKAESQYCLKAHKVSQITAQQSIKLYESIYLKFYKGNSQVTNTNWYENELRIFVWALVCYIYVYQRRIEDLGQEDWKFFSTIFDRKDPKLFEYQSQAIYSTSKGKNWQKQQDEYLKKIMQNKSNKTKWNQVSKQLFQLSNKTHFRTAKQCRERWNNHLDPSKIKGYWKAEQCLAMFQYVREHGKKWANVVKILNDTRNEHSIKNKFNSIIKKHKKQYKTQNQNEIYEQVINRIKKTIENKLLYQNADVSFELQQLNQSLNLSEKEDQIPTCHLVTQNFLRILHNFNSSQNPVRNRYKQQQQSCRFIKNLFQQQKYKSNINKIEKAQYSPNFQSSIYQEKGMVQQTNSQKNPQHYDEFGFDFLGNFNNYRVPQYTFQNGFTSNGMHYRPQFLYPRDFGNRNRWV